MSRELLEAWYRSNWNQALAEARAYVPSAPRRSHTQGRSSAACGENKEARRTLGAISRSSNDQNPHRKGRHDSTVLSVPVASVLVVGQLETVDDRVLEDAETVQLLAEIEPGPLAITLLNSIDVSCLDEDARIDVVAAWERQAAWVAAQTQRALAAVPEAAPVPGPQIISPEELRNASLAVTLRWSSLSASYRLDAACRLVESLPGMLGLLETGQVSLAHARVLAEAASELTREQVTAVEARVLARAPRQTVAEFARSVRRAVHRVAPASIAARHTRAVAERGVRRGPVSTGWPR